MLICGSARSPCSNWVPPDSAGDVLGGARQDLHHPARARVRGLVAELGLLVDDRGDQGRVEVLSAACWRMMSSCRRGSVISQHRVLDRAARGDHRRRGHAETIASTIGHGAALARRDWRAAPGGGARELERAAGGGSLAGGYASIFPSTLGQLLCNSSSVPSLRTVKSARCDFSSCVSWRDGPRLDAGVAARAGALLAHGLVGHDRDRRVEAVLHAGLEQQRHLDHGGARRVAARVHLGPPLPIRCPTRGHSRPSSHCAVVVAEDLLGDLPRSICPSGATSSPNFRPADRGSRRCEQLVDDRVGRQRRGAESLERLQCLGLARCDPAGQADEGHAGARARHRLRGRLVVAGVGVGAGRRPRPRGSA